jgi:hypothetical protein
MVASMDAAPRTGAPTRRTGAPLPLAAAVAALWAALLGVTPVLLLAMVGAIGTGASMADAAGIGAGAWLLSHGVPVTTPTDDRITLMPLAVTLWVGWRLTRAGVHASRATGALRAVSAWPAVRAGLAVGAGYGALGALVAKLAHPGGAEVPVLRAAVTFGAVATVAAVAGALARARAGRRLLYRVPGPIVDAARTGLAATAFLLATGAALAGLALALAGGEATQMLAAYQAGIAGQIGITALCLVYLPNLAVWGAAYLVGPGFALGTGTVVSPGDVLLGPVPALPVFAALPSAPLTGVGPALLVAPLLAGVAAGLLGNRGRAPSTGADAGWGVVLGSAALAGPVAGVLVFLAALASRGSLGSGRLADVGADDPRVAVFAALLIGVGAVAGATARRWLSRAR